MKCPNGCSEENFTVDRLEEHMKNECQSAQVVCGYC